MGVLSVNVEGVNTGPRATRYKNIRKSPSFAQHLYQSIVWTATSTGITADLDHKPIGIVNVYPATCGACDGTQGDWDLLLL